MAQPIPPPIHEKSVPLRILIVEDNDDFRALLCLKFERSGYMVYEAADGASAVTTARSASPDVALIDVGLPGISGYEVARTFRSEPALSAMKLIAITGYCGDAHRELAREAGFDAHVVKPVTSEQLIAIASGIRRT